MSGSDLGYAAERPRAALRCAVLCCVELVGDVRVCGSGRSYAAIPLWCGATTCCGSVCDADSRLCCCSVCDTGFCYSMCDTDTGDAIIRSQASLSWPSTAKSPTQVTSPRLCARNQSPRTVEPHTVCPSNTVYTRSICISAASFFCFCLPMNLCMLARRAMPGAERARGGSRLACRRVVGGELQPG